MFDPAKDSYNKLKTLHIIPNINAKMGGSVYAVINILMLEKNMDIRSTVLSIKADEPDPNLFEFATVKILRASFPKRFSRIKMRLTMILL